MATITFDTLRLARKLEAGGFTAQQAAAAAEALSESLGEVSDLATKKDLEQLRSDIKAELADIKTDMLKWVFTAMAAQTGVIVALLKFLP